VTTPGTRAELFHRRARPLASTCTPFKRKLATRRPGRPSCLTNDSCPINLTALTWPNTFSYLSCFSSPRGTLLGLLASVITALRT
jgi:hypothetical protein